MHSSVVYFFIVFVTVVLTNLIKTPLNSAIVIYYTGGKLEKTGDRKNSVNKFLNEHLKGIDKLIYSRGS
jgi:hypothetical protein